VRALRDRPEDLRGERALGRCERELERMVELVEDLLTLMRAEDLPMVGESIDSQDLIGECAADIRALFPAVELQIRPGTTSLWGQREPLKRALLNVLENACNYSPEGQPVEVWAEETAEHSILHVLDHGQGVAPEWIPRLGQRFFRPDPSRCRQTGGSGLGLSIVKSTLERHGGQLLITSELNRYTRVSLQLPKT
jgi:signal transduction histidine kinase